MENKRLFEKMNRPSAQPGRPSHCVGGLLGVAWRFICCDKSPSSGVAQGRGLVTVEFLGGSACRQTIVMAQWCVLDPSLDVLLFSSKSQPGSGQRARPSVKSLPFLTPPRSPPSGPLTPAWESSSAQAEVVSVLGSFWS